MLLMSLESLRVAMIANAGIHSYERATSKDGLFLHSMSRQSQNRFMLNCRPDEPARLPADGIIRADLLSQPFSISGLEKIRADWFRTLVDPVYGVNCI